MISTRDLSKLPDIDALRRLMQSLAVLDAILQPKWERRYFSFEARWAKGEQMGSMRNGQGDELFAHFTPAGCFIKGFAHEAGMSPYRDDGSLQVWEGVLDFVPDAFAKSLSQPAISMEDTTFCVWRLNGEAAWSCGEIQFPEGEDPDGSEWLLGYYDGKPETYREYASYHFRTNVPLEVVREMYAHEPLTKEALRSLNPKLGLEDLEDELDEIGYPLR